MARVTSLPPVCAITMEPSHDPGWRPHLSILIDLICPSYNLTVAAFGAPAPPNDSPPTASAAQSRSPITTLLRFICPPPSGCVFRAFVHFPTVDPAVDR